MRAKERNKKAERKIMLKEESVQKEREREREREKEKGAKKKERFLRNFTKFQVNIQREKQIYNVSTIVK